MNICVIGAGYVGLITALSFSKMKNKVICVDKDIEKINKLNKGVPTIYEDGLKDLLNESLTNKTIVFTNDIGNSVRSSEIIFITVGTPTIKDWDVDMTQIKDVIEQISKYIDDYKVIVNKSTVPVGTQKYVKEILMNIGVAKENFDIISNPEFLREGEAINDFINGDRLVIGYDSEKARKVMEKLYEDFNIETVFTTPETAEIIKYASNAFLATKISFINEVANLCNKVGADIETVSYAMGLDKRISPKFLRAGIGFGGSCFPKDTKALVKIGEKYGCEFNVVKSAIKTNEYQKDIPIKILSNHYGDLEGKTISILGLSFKPETDDFRDAPSLHIIKELLKSKATVKCYDPMVSKDIQKIFPNIEYAKSMYETMNNSFGIIICTEWDEFLEMDLEEVKQRMNRPLIIDGRNIFKPKEIEGKEIYYYSIGTI